MTCLDDLDPVRLEHSVVVLCYAVLRGEGFEVDDRFLTGVTLSVSGREYCHKVAHLFELPALPQGTKVLERHLSNVFSLCLVSSAVRPSPHELYTHRFALRLRIRHQIVPTRPFILPHQIIERSQHLATLVMHAGE